jgi:hypothetical protein
MFFLIKNVKNRKTYKRARRLQVGSNRTHEGPSLHYSGLSVLRVNKNNSCYQNSNCFRV